MPVKEKAVVGKGERTVAELRAAVHGEVLHEQVGSYRFVGRIGGVG
jgi:hypothetical protein